jgi:hypothetical protein
VAVGATDGRGLGLGENPDRREAIYKLVLGRSGVPTLCRVDRVGGEPGDVTGWERSADRKDRERTESVRIRALLGGAVRRVQERRRLVARLGSTRLAGVDLARPTDPTR